MTGGLLFVPSTSSAAGSEFSNTLAGSWVQDSVGNVFWLVQETDTDGVITYTYYDQPGGSVQVPVGNVDPVQDSNIQIIKRCDDVLVDGSVIVTFFRVNVYDESGDILASIPQTAAGLPYTILGNEVDPKDETIDVLNEIATSSDNIDTTTQAILSDTSSIDSEIQEINGKAAGSFINFEFDEVDLTYVAAGAAQGEIETAVYKLATVTVGTITMTYNVQGDLTNVVRT